MNIWCYINTDYYYVKNKILRNFFESHSSSIKPCSKTIHIYQVLNHVVKLWLNMNHYYIKLKMVDNLNIKMIYTWLIVLVIIAFRFLLNSGWFKHALSTGGVERWFRHETKKKWRGGFDMKQQKYFSTRMWKYSLLLKTI